MRQRNPNPKARRQARLEMIEQQELELVKAKLIRSGWKYDDKKDTWSSPTGSKFKATENQSLDLRCLANINNVTKEETRKKSIAAIPDYLHKNGWTQSERGIWSRDVNGHTIKRSTAIQAHKTQLSLTFNHITE